MKISLSIRLKATFLIIVFLLNTMVGFACSVGWDMSFNKDHHGKPSGYDMPKEHSHPPGTKKHSHEHKTAQNTKDHHKQGAKQNEGGCCKDEVAKFVAVDKQISKEVSIKAPQLFPGILHNTYSLTDETVVADHTPDNSFFVRCHHPPIPDIRIAVQSFQI
jgi:hypothetical protein